MISHPKYRANYASNISPRFTLETLMQGRTSLVIAHRLSTYARQFLQLMDKPDVDMIEGLSPAISIEQKATSHNPRSTVGTVTEIHDYRDRKSVV